MEVQTSVSSLMSPFKQKNATSDPSLVRPEQDAVIKDIDRERKPMPAVKGPKKSLQEAPDSQGELTTEEIELTLQGLARLMGR